MKRLENKAVTPATGGGFASAPEEPKPKPEPKPEPEKEKGE